MNTIDATQAFPFVIKRADVMKADFIKAKLKNDKTLSAVDRKRLTGQCCVIAQAVKRTLAALGNLLAIEVGTNITRVYLSDRIVRFSTPGNLREEIRVWDRTGVWKLGVGYEFELKAVPKAHTREALKAAAKKKKTSYVRGHVRHHGGEEKRPKKAEPTRLITFTPDFSL